MLTDDKHIGFFKKREISWLFKELKLIMIVKELHSNTEAYLI